MSSVTVLAEKATEEQSRRVLEHHGLSVERHTWILDDERQLRRDLERLDQLERFFYSANEKFLPTTRAYRAQRDLKANADEAREALNGQLARPGITPLARQQIDQQIKRIDNQIKPTEQALRGDLNLEKPTSALSIATLDYIEATNGLGLALLDVRRHLDSMERQYERLAHDERIQQVLQQLPADNRIGPLEKYRGRYLPRIERLQQAVFAKHVPVYRHAGQYRIPAILDERAPVTFGHTGSKGHLLLTASALQAAGIEIPVAAAGEKLAYEDRDYTIRAITIPRLRFGKHVLANVAGWALPPEAEHHGCRLSDESLPGSGAVLDEKLLHFRVRGE